MEITPDGLPRIGTQAPASPYERLLLLPGCPVSTTGVQRTIALKILKELSFDELVRLERKWSPDDVHSG